MRRALGLVTKQMDAFAKLGFLVTAAKVNLIFNLLHTLSNDLSITYTNKKYPLLVMSNHREFVADSVI